MELYIKAGRLREQQSEGDRESQQQKKRIIIIK